jgi:hypothetical protein
MRNGFYRRWFFNGKGCVKKSFLKAKAALKL